MAKTVLRDAQRVRTPANIRAPGGRWRMPPAVKALHSESMPQTSLERNHILHALPPAERERLYPNLQLVSMPLGRVVYESGARLRHIYFPVDCIVSLLYVLKDGASAEIA